MTEDSFSEGPEATGNPGNAPVQQEVAGETRRIHIYRKRWFGLLAVVGLSVIAALLFQITKPEKLPSRIEAPVVRAETKEPMSRQVMYVAEQVVKDIKPPPTTAALQYAYVAGAYHDALTADGQRWAWQVSLQILEMLYPDQTARINEEMEKIAQANGISTVTADFSDEAHKVAIAYMDRYKNDKHDLLWDGKVPVGQGKWQKPSPVDPFTPRAGEWQRWIVSKAIIVPPPPIVGSAQDLQELEKVKQASASRNGEDVNKINFWGGAPGTESPGGIWQNQLYETVKGDLPSDAAQADKLYSELQKVLAQTISDSFMECWKVKYTYWTARPSMRIPGLVTAMKDPNFPSYVSGHSTISKASADVLGVMAPKYANEWQAMAVEARDSRLSAGIHYEVDNMAGFDLGTEVAKQAVTNLNLRSLIQ